jgi:tetratricopeptide (TPR) repeat protein
MGRLEEAAQDYETAIAESPPYPEPHYNRGDLAAQRGDLETAIAELSYVLELESTFVDAFANRAALRLQTVTSQAPTPRCPRASGCVPTPRSCSACAAWWPSSRVTGRRTPHSDAARERVTPVRSAGPDRRGRRELQGRRSIRYQPILPGLRAGTAR